MQRVSNYDHPTAKHGKDLCLLSLDGGGVRGLSSLCILDELMRKVDPQNPPKPCDYFDLIGGTSTGGLIAIMLGRLRLTTGECREAYRELSAEAFELKNYQAAPAWKMPWNWDLKARFNSDALERGIKKIIVTALRRDPANDSKTDTELANTLLRDTVSDCKVFVTATAESMPDRTSVLTTYESDRWPRDLLDSVKIWEAARATSAASTFFEPIQVGLEKETFLDGATGANNPVNVVWDEAQDIWKCTGPTEDDVQCLVSIGTGVPAVKAFGGSLKSIGNTLKDMSTETEKTAEAFLRRYTRLQDDQRYFRFNVLNGLGDIGLEEATKLALIVTATRRYLTSEEPKKQLENCAKNLGLRQWLLNLPHILIRATREHSAAIGTLQKHGEAHGLDLTIPKTWLEAMPEYQQWMTIGQGPLLCVKARDMEMSALVSHIISKERPFGFSFTHTIYIDCSRYPRSNDQAPERSILTSAIFQSLHINPKGLDKLREYLQVNRQRTGWQLRNLLDKADVEDSRDDHKLLVDVLGSTISHDNVQSLLIIDNADNSRWQGLMMSLVRRLSSDNNRIMILSSNSTVLNGLSEQISVINDKVETQHCIRSLKFEEWNQRLNIVEKPLNDTTNWVLTHPAALKLRHDAGLLWIRGKPGSGKSTIARMLAERHYLESQSPQESIGSPMRTITVNFFYSARLGEKSTRHYYMLRSILYQVLKHCPALYAFPRDIYRRLLGNDETWKIHDLMHALELILKNYPSDAPSLFCVLDAFDEADEIDNSLPDAIPVLPWLAELTSALSSQRRLRIIILSRHTSYVSRILGSYPSIVVEDNNEKDIKNIVRNGLRKIEKSVTDWIRQDCGQPLEHDADLQSHAHDMRCTLEYLEKRILEKADGTTQWVVSVLSILQSQIDKNGVYTQGELEDVIDTLPQGLHELYTELSRRLVKRLTPRELLKARLMLTWVCHARRPLSLDEFRDALAIAGWKEHMRQDQFSQHMVNQRLRLLQVGNWAPVERDIVDKTGCLLEVVRQPHQHLKQRADTQRQWIRAEDLVQGTHQTVKEFLTESVGTPGPLNLAEEECRKCLATSVAVYLRAASSELKWALQLLRKSAADLETHEVLAPFDVETERAIEHVVKYLAEMPLLRYIMVFYNTHLDSSSLQDLLNDRARKELDQFFGNGRRPTVWRKTAVHYAFDIACEHGFISVIQFLLNVCGLDESALQSALFESIQARNMPTFDALLVHGKLTSITLHMAFHATIAWSWSEAFQMLLLCDRGLIGDTISSRIAGCGSTPLHTAARLGRQDMAVTLLDHDLNIDATDIDGRTALMIAVKTGNVKLAEVFLSKGSDSSLRDLSGKTALYYTAFHLNNDVVRALLACGSLDDALKGALDTLLEDGYDREYQAFCHIYGTRRRRNSWPKLLDLSAATLNRHIKALATDREHKTSRSRSTTQSKSKLRSHRFNDGACQFYLRNFGVWKQITSDIWYCSCPLGPRDEPHSVMRGGGEVVREELNSPSVDPQNLRYHKQGTLNGQQGKVQGERQVNGRPLYTPYLSRRRSTSHLSANTDLGENSWK